MQWGTAAVGVALAVRLLLPPLRYAHHQGCVAGLGGDAMINALASASFFVVAWAASGFGRWLRRAALLVQVSSAAIAAVNLALAFACR